jgi:hypothetical protein
MTAHNLTVAGGHGKGDRLMSTPVTLLDSNTERVKAFAAKMFEAGSIARIADAVVDIATSGAWRDYDINGHPSHWWAAEFDYFLITCGVKYSDMKEVFKGRANAAVLAPMLDQHDEQHHRPLKVASDAWGLLPPTETYPAGKSLIGLAKELGWVNDRGRSRKPPVGRRSRARAAGGSREARAREARRLRIGPERCAELMELVAALAEELSTDELRFVAEELNVVAGQSDGGFAK